MSSVIKNALSLAVSGSTLISNSPISIGTGSTITTIGIMKKGVVGLNSSDKKIQYISKKIYRLGYIPLANTADLYNCRNTYTASSKRKFAIGTPWLGYYSTSGVDGKYIQVNDIDLEWTNIPSNLKTWNNYTTYIPGDVVNNLGTISCCIKENINTVPTATSYVTDTSYWQFVALYSVFYTSTASYGWKGIASFTGTFDGCGYLIKNLTMKQTSGTAALILDLASVNANLYNIIIPNCDISATSYAAPLVGRVNYAGTISNCFASGMVNSSAQYYASGLISYLNYSVSTVVNCAAAVSILQRNAAGQYVGGLSSGAYGTISTCYSIGMVNTNVGSNYGGLVGRATYITSSYFDQNTSGQIDTKGTKSTTLQMLSITNSAWDRNVWEFKSNRYPILKIAGLQTFNLPPATNMTAVTNSTLVVMSWKYDWLGTSKPLAFNIYGMSSSLFKIYSQPLVLTPNALNEYTYSVPKNLIQSIGGSGTYSSFVKAIFNGDETTNCATSSNFLI